MTERKYTDDFIRRALAEDIGEGDHSSRCSIPENHIGKTVLVAKEEGILAGLEQSLRVFELIDPEIRFDIYKNDGEKLKDGDEICLLEGKSINLLQGERLFLNLLQRMSGIATRTDKLVQLIAGTKARLLDTRKTTPNMRVFEKYAVRVGGGVNHRMGLYDMIMLKDNHVDFAGGILQAISKARKYLEDHNLDIPIEIETRNLTEVEEVIQAGHIQRIMFDNFSVEDTATAVKMVAGKFESESSGGIMEETIRAYAETGVNFISVGALTHSVKSLDLSLKAI